MNTEDHTAQGSHSGDKGNEGGAPKNAADANSSLVWIAKHGPRWARVPAIIIALLVAAVPTVLLLSNNLEKWLFHSVGDAAGGQLSMAATADATLRSATLHALLSKPNISDDDRKVLDEQMGEMDHELGHLSNPKDDVKWTVFEKVTTKDYFGYKLFPSDKCLLIARIENGMGSARWLRDPNHPAPRASASAPDSQLGQGFLRALTTHLVTCSNQFQASLHFALDRQGLELEPGWDQSQEAQGTCLNPHPWPYQEAWGAYVNQCQQPVYRQWNDGCRHVQLYDHCTNTWGPVVWQVCVPNHHP